MLSALRNGGVLEPMPVTQTIKNTPDDDVRRLRLLAERNLTPLAALAEARRLGLRNPSESAQIIRADRDNR